MSLQQAYEVISQNNNKTTEQQRKEAMQVIKAHEKEFYNTLASL